LDASLGPAGRGRLTAGIDCALETHSRPCPDAATDDCELAQALVGGRGGSELPPHRSGTAGWEPASHLRQTRPGSGSQP
jgi:hypothetical protein